MKHRPRVLLVDDYPGILSAFERLIAPSCTVVGCVSEAPALLDSVARLRPDVIVVDLSMLGSNALETLGRLANVAPQSRTVVVTATDSPPIREAVLAAGAFAFVSKYRAVDELLPAIRSAVDPAAGHNSAPDPSDVS